ncbi:MAG: TlpA disulfide reductase family protein [Candidatus Acidiferrales bacterium]
MRTRSILAVLAAAILILAAGLLVIRHAVRASSRVEAPAPLDIAPDSASLQHSDAKADAKPIVLYFAENPDAVPPFLARDISGGVVSTAALKGKVVIINFWATWCGPCREEIPELVALQSQYKDTLQIIGVSEDEAPPEQVAKFAQKAGINYPVIMASEAIEKEYGGIPALPTSFLVNKDGRIVQKDVGVYPLDYYNLQVRSLMGLPVNARIETFKDTGQIFLKNAERASQLPGVSFAGLTPAQKKIVLHRLNAETCTCGCQLTLAECRINDTTCPISGSIATKIVRSIAHPNAAITTVSPKPGATP